MASLEIQKNSPSSAPSSAPSDVLLKNYKATIQIKWEKFDGAVPEMGKSGMFASQAYKQAKIEYEKSMQLLNGISTDSELRTNTQILQQLETTIAGLNTHLRALSESDRKEAYNLALVDMRNTLAELRGEITGKKELSEEAKLGSEKGKIAATAAGSGISLISDADASEIKNEIGGEIKKALGPWGMIFRGVDGVPAKEVAAQVKDIAKEYHDKKWTENPFDKFLSMIQLFLLKWQIGRAGIDLSGDMTEEEMKMVGISGISKNSVKGQKEKQGNVVKYTTISAGITKISPEEAQKGGLNTLLNLPKIKSMTMHEASQYNGRPVELLHVLGDLGGINEAATIYLLRILFDPASNLHSILRNRFSKVYPEKDIKNATIEEILSTVGQDIHVLSLFRSIDLTNYQNSLEKLGSNLFRYDSQKQEVSGELVEKANSLGISPVLLTRFLVLDSRQSFTDAKSIEALKSTEGLTDSDKEMIDKIAQFGVNFIQTIKTNKVLNLGNGEAIESILAKKNIAFSDIMKSYILTGGECDISKMDTVHRIGAYTSFMLIVGQDSGASGAVTGSIINIENAYRLFKDRKDPFDMIPDDVKTFFKDTVSLEKIWDTIAGAFGGMEEYIKEYAKKSPGLTVFLVLAVLFLPVFSKRTNLASILTGK